MSYISAAQAKQIAQKAVDNLKDGTLVPKLADNLTPYAEDSGTTQTQPFFLEGTATGNGESRVDAKQVPAYAFLQEKRGNMVTVNQLHNPVTKTRQGITATYDSTKGTYTLSGTSTTSYADIFGEIPIITGRKYLTWLTIIKNPNSVNMQAGILSGVSNISTSGLYKIGEAITTDTKNAGISGFSANTDFTGVEVAFFCVDLTQWFNNNIPAYLLSHPEAFGRYYKGSLAYEPGRLVPATGRYIESEGRNILDEEWEVGVINTSTGIFYPTGSILCSKNFREVNSNTPYIITLPNNYPNSYGRTIFFYDYDGNFIDRKTEYVYNIGTRVFITPSNAHYIKIMLNIQYGTTYKNDITISRYYEGESGYDKYYPHKVLATIDTGTEQLGVFDYKVPSGLITRKTGSADLGTLKFYLNAGTYPSHSFYSRSVSDIKSDSTLLCADTTIISRGDYKLGLYTNGTAIIVVTKVNYNSEQELKDALSGIIAHYELATPTTEQGTPFQENVPIDDFGQLSWSDTNVPQGNQIFYPVDYKAAIDTLINYTDGDITGLAKRGSLTDTDPQTLKALVDYVNGKIPAAPTTDGTYDLVCTVTNGEPTFSWVART